MSYGNVINLQLRLAGAIFLAGLVGTNVMAASDKSASKPLAPKEQSQAKLSAADTPESVPNKPAPVTESPLVAAVIRMNNAEVSPQVIKAYIESAPAKVPLTDAEIIKLKDHKVPDEIVTSLIQTSAKAHAQETQNKNEIIARALTSRNAKYGGMDPEGYDYFRYYYLHPRALESAYQRLAPYTSPWGPYYGGRTYGFPRHPRTHW